VLSKLDKADLVRRLETAARGPLEHPRGPAQPEQRGGMFKRWGLPSRVDWTPTLRILGGLLLTLRAILARAWAADW
jgi:hypothetical protein